MQDVKTFPHSAAIIIFLKSALLNCCTSELRLSACTNMHPRITIMGKRGSTAAIGDAATKKSKKTAASRDSDSPTIGDWDCSKFVEKDLHKATKEELLKDDAEEVHVPGTETTPTPPTGFRVMFMAFILRRLSFPAHDFLRGLLFAYGVQ
jgi:hypothetical protein